jgi:hypothetical protein
MSECVARWQERSVVALPPTFEHSSAQVRIENFSYLV